MSLGADTVCVNWKSMSQLRSVCKGSLCMNSDVAHREANMIPLLCLDHLNKDVVQFWRTTCQCSDILKRHGRKGEKTKEKVCTKDDWKGHMKTASREKKTPKIRTLVCHVHCKERVRLEHWSLQKLHHQMSLRTHQKLRWQMHLRWSNKRTD